VEKCNHHHFCYSPVQVPALLNRRFQRNLLYTETMVPECADFAICFWQMSPRILPNETVDNIILPDGCIDFLANVNEMAIGFSGMKKTDFHYPVPAGTTAFGFRLRPGAFKALTGLSASMAMDAFLPLEKLDAAFSATTFSQLSLPKKQQYMKETLQKLIANRNPGDYIELFEELYQKPVETVRQLCARIGYSQKQTERLFMENYGLSPKVVLSIIRFQQALVTLTAKDASPSDILRVQGYYDQPHLIKDVKQSIGLTPLELIHRCGEDDENLQSPSPVFY